MTQGNRDTEETVNFLLKGKKTLQGRLTRMQKALNEWDELGGLETAIRKAEIVQDGLEEYEEDLEKSLPTLREAAKKQKERHIELFYQSLQTYAKERGLLVEGTLSQNLNEPAVLHVGDYQVHLQLGEEAEVTFAENTVGTLTNSSKDDVASEFDDIRERVEVNTDKFLKKLETSYTQVTGTQGDKALIGKVLRRFIINIQPASFWENASSGHLNPYNQVNFAWEILRESRKETPPFKLIEASVHANVSAAGSRNDTGNNLVLILDGVGKPRLYSHITWAQQ